ncbi:hypothetical protein SAMN05444487_10436 [Marininema mesophilum]|uniref:Uncharacterized protein n=1 Tax=Marininema mesophilum TaxID=1048340 RepID=A0A1H2U8J5_9BACL|nr:hypothetical protein [Marininema mesophilum]SDW52533.1 hypothetical protein SAMN05444487_10436 [Marininema mesophilum]
MFKKLVDNWKKYISHNDRHGTSQVREEPDAHSGRIREWKRMAEEHINKDPDATVYKGDQMELVLREEGFVIRPQEKTHQSDVWKKHSTHWRNFWLYDNEREIEFSLIEEVKLNWDRQNPGGSLEIRYREVEDGELPTGEGGCIPFHSWPQFFAMREARDELERRTGRLKE